MVPNKGNLILAVVLVVQIVVTGAIFLPTVSSSQIPSSGPLLKDFNSDNVLELIIRDNANGELDLVKQGSSWVLPKADNYPATTANVSAFLDKLKALQSNRLIAQAQSSQSRLHVAADTYERLVEIQQSGNKVTRLYIGTSGGANATHMRVDGQAQIYLTSGLATTDASVTASAWINPTYFSITQDNIVKLSIKNANGLFNLSKVNGLWILDGLGAAELFNANSLTTLLAQVSNVTINEPLGTTSQDKFGLQSPLAVVSITTREQVTPTAQPTSSSALAVPFGPTRTPTTAPTVPSQTIDTTSTLQIGAKQANGEYVLKASTSPYFVSVNATTAETFLNVKRSDLVTAAPTPTAAAARPF